MGRRSSFARRKNDAYDTPAQPVRYLLPHLLPRTRFIEPCAGRGDLIRHLEEAGHYCMDACDIDGERWPSGRQIVLRCLDASTQRFTYSAGACFITNPPWTRALLHPIIENLSGQLPTWLLFDADWPNNATIPQHLLDRCERIVPAGRVKWIPDSAHAGKDNVCWYRFDATHSGGPKFFGRKA